jgi:hypothetical protein
VLIRKVCGRPDVILDDGFFLRRHRVRHVELARAATKIHFIDTPLQVIRARLAQRNASLPPFNFRIEPICCWRSAVCTRSPPRRREPRWSR